jgi:hypothetical protein
MAAGRAGATPTTLLAVARGADVYFEEGQVGFVHNFQFGQLGHGPGGS